MALVVIPRSEWEAQYADAYRDYDAPLPADEVWLHHSVTIAPDLLPPFTDDYEAIRTLEQIGQNRFGWGISYTWPITPAGLVFQGHRVNGVGTHTANRNSRARAICFVGNYENDKPTQAQIRSAAWLLQHAKRKGWIREARINGGHRDLKATACPGHHAYAAIPEINRLAAGPRITEEDTMSQDDIERAVLSLLKKAAGEATGGIDSQRGRHARDALWKIIRYPLRKDVRSVIEAQRPLLEAAAKGHALSAEEVQRIATAAAAAVPDNLAADVLDELHDRLAEQEQTS